MGFQQQALLGLIVLRLFLVFALTALPRQASGEAATEWTRFFPRLEDLKVAVDATGFVYVSGFSTKDTCTEQLTDPLCSEVFSGARVIKLASDNTPLVGYSLRAREDRNLPEIYYIDSAVAPNGDVFLLGTDRNGAAVVRLFAQGSPDPARDYRPALGGLNFTPELLKVSGNSIAIVGNTYPDPAGKTDLVVVKLDVASQRQFVRQIGGSDEEGSWAVEVDKSGAVYLLGNTRSQDFPVTPGAYEPKPTYRSSTAPPFLVKFDSFLETTIYATYLSALVPPVNGRNRDPVLAVRGNEQACLAGQVGFDRLTTGEDETLIPTETFFGEPLRSPGLIFCLDPLGRQVVVSRAINDFWPTALTIDTSGNLWVAGQGLSHVFLAQMNPDGTSLLGNAALGGATSSTGRDSATSLVISSGGDVYVAGAARSSRFPAAPEPPPYKSADSQDYVAKFAANRPRADVSVTIEDVNPPGGVVGGTWQVMTVRLTNHGPGIARDIVLTHTVSQWRFCRPDEKTLCNAGSGDYLVTPQLRPGESSVYRLHNNSIFDTSWVVGKYRIAVRSATNDPDLSNNLSEFTSGTGYLVWGAFNSDPPGLKAFLGDRLENFRLGEGARRFISGAVVPISFENLQVFDGVTYTFQEWSDGSTENPRFYRVPEANFFGITAIFKPDRHVLRAHPSRVRVAGVAGEDIPIRVIPVPVLIGGTHGMIFTARPVEVDWLSLKIVRASTGNDLGVEVLYPKLPGPGVYTTELIVDSERAENSPLRIPFEFEFLAGKPRISAEGIVNAASYAPGVIAPGTILSIFGENLGPAVPPVIEIDAYDHFPVTAGGVVVRNGPPFALLAVLPNQVNTVVSPNLNPRSLEGEIGFLLGNSLNVVSGLRGADVQPGVFSLDASGRGQAAALNQDSSINGPTNPARRGQLLVVYGTGFGKLDQSYAPQSLVVLPLPRPLASVGASLGGASAEVLYAGGSPGATVGLTQVNLRVPADGPTGGAVPLILIADGVPSQQGITVAIK